MEKPKELEGDSHEDSLDWLIHSAQVHAEKAAEMLGCAVTINYHNNVTRDQIAYAYGQVLEETRANRAEDPNKLLEAEYKFRILNEQFEKECKESEARYLEILTTPEDE